MSFENIWDEKDRCLLILCLAGVSLFLCFYGQIIDHFLDPVWPFRGVTVWFLSKYRLSHRKRSGCMNYNLNLQYLPISPESTFSSQILTIHYRNPKEILQFLWRWRLQFVKWWFKNLGLGQIVIFFCNSCYHCFGKESTWRYILYTATKLSLIWLNPDTHTGYCRNSLSNHQLQNIVYGLKLGFVISKWTLVTSTNLMIEILLENNTHKMAQTYYTTMYKWFRRIMFYYA